MGLSVAGRSLPRLKPKVEHNMRKLLIVLALVSTPALAQQTVYVRGHTTAQGTYVPPSTRTAPNSTQTDNWSTKGNVNPNNGRAGTRTATH